jgi:hypothetical protein
MVLVATVILALLLGSVDGEAVRKKLRRNIVDPEPRIRDLSDIDDFYTRNCCQWSNPCRRNFVHGRDLVDENEMIPDTEPDSITSLETMDRAGQQRLLANCQPVCTKYCHDDDEQEQEDNDDEEEEENADNTDEEDIVVLSGFAYEEDISPPESVSEGRKSKGAKGKKVSKKDRDNANDDVDVDDFYIRPTAKGKKGASKAKDDPGDNDDDDDDPDGDEDSDGDDEFSDYYN